MKNYKIVQLEDMLGHVYSGRADVAMIDELIAWLQLRRESVVAEQVKLATPVYWDFGARPCPECGKVMSLHNYRFRLHGPRNSRCPGSFAVYVEKENPPSLLP